jgi:hypothetical protein
MKTGTLCNYAQLHAHMWLILNGLRSPYDRAHEPYDQTHGAYDQTHASSAQQIICKLLKNNILQYWGRHWPRLYMEWFMVWITLTKGNRPKHIVAGFGWFRMCLPIKTAPPRVLDRKSLEQNAGLMLQTQWTHFVL